VSAGVDRNGSGADLNGAGADVHRAVADVRRAVGDVHGAGESPVMVSLGGVTVRFGRKMAVSDVSEQIGEGEWVGLIGPNGAGKTSLLRALARLLPHSGSIRIRGLRTSSLSHKALARLVAYVPQHPELPPDMTVGSYVLLGRTPHIRYFGVESAADRGVCSGLLDSLELADMAERPLGTLSGGELQRLVLARALAQEAPVLVLDEPTSALDLGRRVDALELVDTLRRQRHLTVVSAMHDLTLAGQFADRLVLLDRGRAVVTGTPAEVLTEEALVTHFDTRVRVLRSDDGDLVVVPVRARPGEAASSARSQGRGDA
jgi:iron complex transport system ATP-binding protein